MGSARLHRRRISMARRDGRGPFALWNLIEIERAYLSHMAAPARKTVRTPAGDSERAAAGLHHGIRHTKPPLGSARSVGLVIVGTNRVGPCAGPFVSYQSRRMALSDLQGGIEKRE